MSDKESEIYQLASDGKVLTWTDGSSVYGYDLDSRQLMSSPIVQLGPNDDYRIEGIALDEGILYYALWYYPPPTPGDPVGSGGGPLPGPIYAHDLRTGQERKIVEHGENPVAGDGVLLWRAERQAADSYSYPELHLLKEDGTITDTVLPVERNLFGYQVSGNYIVAGSHPSSDQSRSTYIYNISTGKRTLISTAAIDNPLIKGDEIIWTHESGGGWLGNGTIPVDWAIEAYDTSSRQISTLLNKSAVHVQAEAITTGGGIVLTIGDTGYQWSLYLLELAR